MSGTGEVESERVDVWLWAVRVFKTRALAAAACRAGRVVVDGAAVKAARRIVVGQVLEVEKEGVRLRLVVEGLVAKRVGAKVLAGYVTDETPEEELERARAAREAARQNDVFGDLPSGRPTKRDRRRWETFLRAVKK